MTTTTPVATAVVSSVQGPVALRARADSDLQLAVTATAAVVRRTRQEMGDALVTLRSQLQLQQAETGAQRELASRVTDEAANLRAMNAQLQERLRAADVRGDALAARLVTREAELTGEIARERGRYETEHQVAFQREVEIERLGTELDILRRAAAGMEENQRSMFASEFRRLWESCPLRIMLNYPHREIVGGTFSFTGEPEGWFGPLGNAEVKYVQNALRCTSKEGDPSRPAGISRTMSLVPGTKHRLEVWGFVEEGAQACLYVGKESPATNLVWGPDKPETLIPLPNRLGQVSIEFDVPREGTSVTIWRNVGVRFMGPSNGKSFSTKYLDLSPMDCPRHPGTWESARHMISNIGGNFDFTTGGRHGFKTEGKIAAPPNPPGAPLEVCHADLPGATPRLQKEVQVIAGKPHRIQATGWTDGGAYLFADGVTTPLPRRDRGTVSVDFTPAHDKCNVGVMFQGPNSQSLPFGLEHLSVGPLDYPEPAFGLHAIVSRFKSSVGATCCFADGARNGFTWVGPLAIEDQENSIHCKSTGECALIGFMKQVKLIPGVRHRLVVDGYVEEGTDAQLFVGNGPPATNLVWGPEKPETTTPLPKEFGGTFVEFDVPDEGTPLTTRSVGVRFNGPSNGKFFALQSLAVGPLDYDAPTAAGHPIAAQDKSQIGDFSDFTTGRRFGYKPGFGSVTVS